MTTLATVRAVLSIVHPKALLEIHASPVSDRLFVRLSYDVNTESLRQASLRGDGFMLEDLLSQTGGRASDRFERARLYVEQKRIPFSQRAGRRSGPRLRFYRRFADQELDR